MLKVFDLLWNLLCNARVVVIVNDCTWLYPVRNLYSCINGCWLWVTNKHDETESQYYYYHPCHPAHNMILTWSWHQLVYHKCHTVILVTPSYTPDDCLMSTTVQVNWNWYYTYYSRRSMQRFSSIITTLMEQQSWGYLGMWVMKILVNQIWHWQCSNKLLA